MEDGETSRMHKYGEKKNGSNYDGIFTAHHCLSGTYEISRRWIFVRLSVQRTVSLLEMDILLKLFVVDECWPSVRSLVIMI